jgi:hypothetical protein
LLTITAQAHLHAADSILGALLIDTPE